MDLAYIEKNINALYSAVTDENIKELISGLPKKVNRFCIYALLKIIRME